MKHNYHLFLFGSTAIPIPPLKNIIGLSILSLLWFSCNVDHEPRQFEEPFILAEKNGASWEVMGEALLSGDSLSVWGKGIEEVLWFKIKFEGEGVYELNNNYAHYYTTIGQDAYTSRYEFTRNNTGTIFIDGYDSKNNIIEGSFEINLNLMYGDTGNNPETMEFKNGKFQLNL